jgi:hypothetical protein
MSRGDVPPIRERTYDDQKLKRTVDHWRRERKDGSVDFRFQYGTETLRGTIAYVMGVDGLQALFEQHVGAKLPPARTEKAG